MLKAISAIRFSLSSVGFTSVISKQQTFLFCINLLIRSSASLSFNPLLTGVPVPLEMEAHLPKEIINLLSQPNGYKQAIAFGEQIIKGSPKVYSQTQKEESAADILRKKLDQKSYEAEQDRLSRERIAAARLENARKLVSMRPMKQTKESFESHAVELEKAADAMALDNPQAAAALREKSRFWREEAKAKAAASASTNANLKRDTLKGFGIDIPDSSQAGKEQDPYAGFKIR